MSDIHDLERFKAHAETVQALETVVRGAAGWSHVNSTGRQAINVALDTIARVLHGDHSNSGVWLCGAAALTLAGEFVELAVTAEPQPDADGWIEWKGGECPVAQGCRVDVRFRDGEEEFSLIALPVDGEGRPREVRGAAKRFWHHDNHMSDIIAYRVVK